MKVEWIAFDVGGVLLDWRSSSAALAKELNVTHDLLLETMFKYAPLMNIGEMDSREGWQKILNELGSNMSPNEAIRAWRNKKFWISESLELVKQLRDAGYHLTIFTNSWLGLAAETNRELLPAELSSFEYIIDSSEEGYKKPDLVFYKILERLTKSSGQEILLIDDEPKNLETASELGWQSILFETEQPTESTKAILDFLTSGTS